MHLIIDGYNLLGARGQVGSTTAREGERVRDELIRNLSRYRERKDYAITIVFDAWREQGGIEHHEYQAGVEVIFTRGGERADQVIQRMASQWGKECAVVSSDIEVMASARANGAFVMKSQEFQSKLRMVTHAQSFQTRHRELVEKQVEDTLPVRQSKKGNPRKLPKRVRNRNKKLKGF